MHTTRIDIDPALRSRIIPLLQARPVDAVDLSTEISRDIDRQLRLVEAPLQAGR